MNLSEFMSLKQGDKVHNDMTDSQGEVVETTNAGVLIRWGAKSTGATPLFTYTSNSTAWYHWSFPPRDCDLGPCTRPECRHGDKCMAEVSKREGEAA